MSKPKDLKADVVTHCAQRQDGLFLVVLKNGRTGTAPRFVSPGSRASIKDGSVEMAR